MSSVAPRDASDEFQRERHIKYLLRCLSVLPNAYISMDTSRMTILFFALSGLDLLNALDKIQNETTNIINWIYSLQILPENTDTAATGDKNKCGFRGSHFLGYDFNVEGSFTSSCEYEGSHIAMTYSALLSLLILKDDLSRVNKEAIVMGLKSLQLDNGSFYSTPEGSENDMRFLYCGCCVSYLLQDWRGVDRVKAMSYVKNSLGYDYGVSQGPQLESHGGSTFCAVASLVLMGGLDECFTQRQQEKLKRWCMVRQKNGFQGRPNKPVDTCYSFWVGGTLHLLGAYPMIDPAANQEFLLSTQNPLVGGFSKWPDVMSDILHTYFGLCGLSLMNLYDLQPISPALNISVRTEKHLEQVHQSWKPT